MGASKRIAVVALLSFLVTSLVRAEVTWVLDSVEVNPDNKPMVSYEKLGEQITTDRRFTISENMLTVKTIRRGHVNSRYDTDSQGRTVIAPVEYLGTWNFKFQIPRPPEQVLPGEPVKLTVTGTASGERKQYERIGGRDFSCSLVYRPEQGVSFDRHMASGGAGAPVLAVGERRPQNTQTFTFRINPGTEQRHKKVSFTVGVYPMLIRYTYKAVEGPAPKPAPPVLSWISVEQRHLTYDKAKITVKAKASYPMIGSYDVGQVKFTIRVSGKDTQKKEFDGHAPQVRRQGNNLFLEWWFETRELGGDSVKVTLRDERFDSPASTSDYHYDYEHSLSTQFTTKRPVAEIMVVNRWVAIMRAEHSTVKGGVIVTSERKYHEPKDVDWLRTFADMMGEDTTTPSEYEAARVWESIEQDTSHFVYEGDRIGLAGARDESLRPPLRTNDYDAWRIWVESGTSSVVLEWENGLKGEAIRSAPPSNMPSEAPGYFVVGTSRATSGKWKQTWREWFGEKAFIATEQFISGKLGEAKDAAIDWFLEREGISLPSIPERLSLFLQLFHLSAGGTLVDDMVYLNLNSKVFVSTADGQLKIFTFEGSPEILDPKRGTKVTVKPGQMVTVKPGAVSTPRTFTTEDLVATRKPIQAVTTKQVDHSKKRQGKDIPKLNADIVKFEFFESADPVASLKERTFTRSFDAKTARLIYWHLELDYPKRNSNTTFDLETVWYSPDGSEYGRWTRKFRMEAGWSGSYYSSGWGANNPGTWKPGNYRAAVFLDGQVIAEGSFTVMGSAGREQVKQKQKKPVYDFSQWPLEYKLDVAVSLLETEVRNAANKTARDGYTAARELVDRARREYDRYKGPQDTIYNGSTDPTDCPHGTIKVMRICAEDLLQSQAAWDRSPRSPALTETQVREATEAIRNAEEAMRAAVREVLLYRGWQGHAGRDGLYMEAPPEYERFQNGDWPLSLRVTGPTGKIQRLVMLTWHGKPDGVSAYDFQQQRIDSLRSQLPDFRDLVEWQAWPGVPGHWFTYTYDWEGQRLEAIVYQNPFGPLPWELRVLSADRPLDMAVCEEMVRSLTRK